MQAPRVHRDSRLLVAQGRTQWASAIEYSTYLRQSKQSDWLIIRGVAGRQNDPAVQED